MSCSSCLSVLELVYVSFVIWRDKGWICVSLMLILFRRSSSSESLDNISVVFLSFLSVLELAYVSFVRCREKDWICVLLMLSF